MNNSEKVLINNDIIFCIKRNNNIFIPESMIADSKKQHKVKPTKSMVFLAELMSLGYIPTDELTNKIHNTAEEYFDRFHQIVIRTLREVKGGHKDLVPLFLNFPHDVPEENEYFVSRVMNVVENIFSLDMNQSDYQTLPCGCNVNTRYFDISKFSKCPVCQCGKEINTDISNNKSSVSSSDRITPIVLGLDNNKTLNQTITNILSSVNSITSMEKDYIYGLLNHNLITIEYFKSVLPNNIEHKEIASIVVQATIDKSNDADEALSLVNNYVHTANDVLRVAQNINEHQQTFLYTNLNYNSGKIRYKFSNKKRKIILGLLDTININNALENMKTNSGIWERIGEVIHPACYKKRFPNAFIMFDRIRNEKKTIKTFNGDVKELIDANTSESILKAAELYSKRPGDFSRNLDLLVRKANSIDLNTAYRVCEVFEEVSESISKKLLISVRNNFNSRLNNSSFRVFTPKGNVVKAQVVEDNREKIADEICEYIIKMIDVTLMRQLNDNTSLGRVYIDDELKNEKIPMRLRSAKESTHIMERASTIDIDKHYDILRLFAYWKESKGDRVDLDLSVTFMNNDLKEIDTCNYIELTAFDNDVIHSGDIQEGPGAEFIDIDIESVERKGCRYAVGMINTFTTQPFDSYECFAGVMYRKKDEKTDRVKESRHFDINSVKQKFDIVGQNNANIPFVVDLKSRKIIVINMDLSDSRSFNIFDKSNMILSFVQSIIEESEYAMNLYDFFKLYAKKNGTGVNEKLEKDEEYDTIIGKQYVGNILDFSNKWLT